MEVRVFPGVPISFTICDLQLTVFAALVQRQETLRSERRGWGWKSLTRHQSSGPAPAAHVVQCRDGALKTRTVSVRIRSWAPTACSPMKRHEAQTFESAGASPATRTNLCFVELRLGRPIWNVNRTSGPGLFAKQCVPSGMWCNSTAFRHARVAQSEPAGLYPASH